jgi:hypothetical protein
MTRLPTQEIAIGAALHHLAFRTVTIAVFKTHGQRECAQELAKPGHIKGVRRSGAERA